MASQKALLILATFAALSNNVITGVPMPPRRRISMERYIRHHKTEIDDVIRCHVPGARINNEERRQWILNDEGLYNAARAAGVEDI